MHPFNHIFDKTIVKATVNSQTLMFEDNSGVAHCYDAIGCTFDELDDILEFTQKGPFYVEWMKTLHANNPNLTYTVTDKK